MKKEESLHAIELFYFAYRSFTAKPDRILKELGLSRVHHRILYFVGRNSGININQLLQILAVSKQALNAPLRKLIEQKLILVELADHDKRIKQLTLSRLGAKLEEKLTKTQSQHLEKVFEKTGEKAVLGWRKIMVKVPIV